MNICTYTNLKSYSKKPIFWIQSLLICKKLTAGLVTRDVTHPETGRAAPLPPQRKGLQSQVPAWSQGRCQSRRK